MSGYRVGPTLAPGEAPFAVGWESDPRVDDGHSHDWETVLIPPGGVYVMQECVRCVVCGCPRCGHSTDVEPCLLRRHHRGDHQPWLPGRQARA